MDKDWIVGGLVQPAGVAGWSAGILPAKRSGQDDWANGRATIRKEWKNLGEVNWLDSLK